MGSDAGMGAAPRDRVFHDMLMGPNSQASVSYTCEPDCPVMNGATVSSEESW